MCHDGINPQPWLMLYIYNHPSQQCHHNSQKTWISSWMVWVDPARVCNPWYVQRPRGPFSVCSHVVESSNGLRLKLESLSFCCALSSLTAQRRNGVWCVFWRPAALSTLRPPHWHYGSWAPQGDREGREGWEWRVGQCTLVKGETERKRDRQRKRGREATGGRVPASVASAQG